MVSAGKMEILKKSNLKTATTNCKCYDQTNNDL